MQGIVAVILAVCVAYSGAVVFKPCSGTDTTGVFKGLSVPSCAKTPVCPLIRGTNVTINFDFIPGGVVTNATSIVHGVIAHIPVPFPLPNPNACGGSVTCPMKAGQQYRLTSAIPVMSSYPKISLTVRWELRDTVANKDIFCIELPVVIK